MGSDRRLIGELRTAMAENADPHARLLRQARHAGVLDERQRMAGEIHDTVAQGLVPLIGPLDAAARAGSQGRRRHAEAPRRGLEVLRLVAGGAASREAVAEAYRRGLLGDRRRRPGAGADRDPCRDLPARDRGLVVVSGVR
ncbi:histidine kinase [Nonomuraea sp. NPDC050383]|uniref:histidine kinase n=1 Tax=Nonomuraea sp. NPDC050383 TaxID=3364362 RepID=UPI00378B2A13